MYLVTDGGVQFVDDDRNPITIDEALVTIRRVAAWVEEIGNEPERDNATAPLDNRAQPLAVRTEAA